MELVLAILLVLGIYVAIPVIIGFAILGGMWLSGRRAEEGKAETRAEVEGKPAEVEREVVGVAGRRGQG